MKNSGKISIHLGVAFISMHPLLACVALCTRIKLTSARYNELHTGRVKNNAKVRIPEI